MIRPMQLRIDPLREKPPLAKGLSTPIGQAGDPPDLFRFQFECIADAEGAGKLRDFLRDNGIEEAIRDSEASRLVLP